MSPRDREAHGDREARREAGREVTRVELVKPHDREVSLSDEDDEWAAETPIPAWLSHVQEWRAIRQLHTTADSIAYAKDGAYSVHPDGAWRLANIVYAYVIATPVILLCDVFKFAFGTRLSRTLIAIPVALALGWALNRIPVTAWITPDWWDISTWWAEPPAIVEVPVEIGEG